MRLLRLTVGVYLALCCGCAQIIIEEIPYEDGRVGQKVKWNTFMKNYRTPFGESISQTLKLDAVIKPVPRLGLEIEGE